MFVLSLEKQDSGTRVRQILHLFSLQLPVISTALNNSTALERRLANESAHLHRFTYGAHKANAPEPLCDLECTVTLAIWHKLSNPHHIGIFFLELGPLLHRSKVTYYATKGTATATYE